MHCTTMSSYKGEYKDGWYHGKGRFCYPDGVIYEGDFYKGEFHGQGKLIFLNGVISLNNFIIYLERILRHLEKR